MMFDWLFKKKETQTVLGSASIEYWSIPYKAPENIVKMVDSIKSNRHKYKTIKRTEDSTYMPIHSGHMMQYSFIFKHTQKDIVICIDRTELYAQSGFIEKKDLIVILINGNDLIFDKNDAKYITDELEPIINSRIDRAKRINEIKASKRKPVNVDDLYSYFD